jgi:hypothetical protein
MAEIINLRQAKKAKARQTKETEAAANRAKFGAPKAERRRTEAEAEKLAQTLDAHKLDRPEEE